MSEDIHEAIPANPVQVLHLPPLLLNLLLPSTYPLEHRPVIQSIQPSHAWLPSPLVEHLTRILFDMWDNECVLSLWVDHIHNGDQLLSSLNLFALGSRSIR